MRTATCTHRSSSVSQSAAPDPDTSPCHAVCHSQNLLPTIKEEMYGYINYIFMTIILLSIWTVLHFKCAMCKIRPPVTPKI